MKDLRRRFERFCLKNRGKGIPNLMLVIAIGNLAVYALSYIDPSNIVYSYLCFSRSAILRGQVWRLFSYIFTYLNDVRGAGLLLAAVSLFCYYQFGKILESYQLFDIYEGAQIEKGFKSMAYSLVFRHHDKTLEENEITAAMKKILNGLTDLGIELRS